MPKKKVLMAVLALIFAVMQILPAFANELEDKQAEYDDVQQKMQQMEIAKERARREAEAASDRMEEIVAELNRLQAEIKEIEAKRDKLQPLIDENQEVLAEKKAKMEGRMKIYRQRLRDIYINGQINYLDVLLGAKDFSDFSSRMFLLQKIINILSIVTQNLNISSHFYLNTTNTPQKCIHLRRTTSHGIRAFGENSHYHGRRGRIRQRDCGRIGAGRRQSDYRRHCD